MSTPIAPQKRDPSRVRRHRRFSGGWFVERLPKRIIYLTIYWFVRLCFLIIWRLDVRGLSHVPPQGAVIIAGNHRSYADPPVISISLRREVHFMAKRELFSFGPFAWLISSLNAHPLNRSSAVEALKAAQEILSNGDALIMFPEGRRMKTDELGPPKSGVGMLAKTTGTPVIPAYVHNSAYMKYFRKVSVSFGPAIVPAYFHTYDALAAEVMRQIQLLKDRHR